MLNIKSLTKFLLIASFLSGFSSVQAMDSQDFTRNNSYIKVVESPQQLQENEGIKTSIAGKAKTVSFAVCTLKKFEELTKEGHWIKLSDGKLYKCLSDHTQDFRSDHLEEEHLRTMLLADKLEEYSTFLFRGGIKFTWMPEPVAYQWRLEPVNQIVYEFSEYENDRKYLHGK